jgi:DNA-binding MurR/RpiR family transcriptional regulator
VRSIQGVCLQKVRSVLPVLSPSEQRIALCVLERPRKAVQSSITELARECEVSESTVVRFCKRLGLDGYKEFRIAVAQELGAVAPEFTAADLDSSNGVRALAQRVFSNNIRAVEATLASLNVDAVNQAIDALSHARRVDFYGAGPSSVVAMDAYIKFMRIGLSASFNSNAHLQVISAAVLTDQDVAVGISYSGSTKDTVEALTIARNAGATAIAITNFQDMPISEAADIVICSNADEAFFHGGAMASRTAQLAVVDLIFAGTINRRAEESAKQLEKTKSALLSKLTGDVHVSSQTSKKDRT